MRTIVVGVDGSAEARAALRWALAEGRLRSARVQVVYAYDYDQEWPPYDDAPRGPFDDVALREVPETWERAAANARRTATALVRGLLRAVGAAAAGVDVELLAVRDRRPARALVSLSQDAELLVVGTRGRGGFSGLLLGSCSQQCLQLAACPVAVVPLESAAPAGAGTATAAGARSPVS
jgi:nucleotide-binding universal stress UspA family protein